MLMMFYLVLTLSFASKSFAQESRFRKIAAPSNLKITKAKIAANGILEIEGSGFIKNFNIANKVYLKPSKNTSKTVLASPKGRGVIASPKGEAIHKKSKRKKKKIKLEVIEVSSNLLKAKIPESLVYGDYELYIKLKTKFFKSKLKKVSEKILIRPKAPAKPVLQYTVIDSSDQISLLIDKNIEIEALSSFEQKNGKINDIEIEIEGLKTGINKIQSYYIDDGFESIRSEAAEFYYIPESEFNNELAIESEEPVEAFAVDNSLEKLDVSEITERRTEELSKSFFLISPNHPRYLLHQKILKALFIESVHVKADEFVVIANRSSEDKALEGCTLSDSIRVRFELTEEIVKAKSSLKITANLGLNDTSPDEISLHCPNEAGELELVDKLSYEKLDEAGFAI